MKLISGAHFSLAESVALVHDKKIPLKDNDRKNIIKVIKLLNKVYLGCSEIIIAKSNLTKKNN
jgi:hypothetical protein